MNDAMFYSTMAYLLIFALFAGILPSSFYTGSTADLSSNDIQGALNVDEISSTSEPVSLGFITKSLIFIFVPITISGMPIVLAGLLQIINLIILFGSGIWIYNKVRGIG